MDILELFNTIEQQKEKYIDFLCDICSFEARAFDKDVIDKLNDFITAFAENEGFSVTRTALEKCGDFLTIDMNNGNEKGGVFLAHTDTVHEKGVFGYPPVKRTDDKIIGPGTIDCKGGIAVALLMMKALKENGYDKHLRLVLTSDEEISTSLGGQKEVDFFADSVKGFPFAIVCETTENNEVVVSRKGILRCKIDITGVSGHSGIHYFECKNAILEAAHKIVDLESKSEHGGTTYSCNIVNGGSVGNIIPDKCSVLVDIRVHKRADINIAKKTVEEVAKKSYIGSTSAVLTKISERPPMEKNQDTMDIFNKLLTVSEKHGLGSLTPVESGGGSDGCYTQAAGIPSICGLGASGEFCHTPKEYVNIETIARRAKILSAFLCE